MSYTSIIINNGNESVGTPIGLSIPNLLDNIEKDDSYVLQFAIRTLNNSSPTLDYIYVGEQKLSSINITNYDTTIIDEVVFYNCYIVFKAQENMLKPSLKIGRLKTSTEDSNKDVLEITRMKLCKGTGYTEYAPSVNDLSILKKEVYTMIQQLSDSITLKAKKEDLDNISGKLSEALGQIQVDAGRIELKAEKDDLNSSIEILSDKISSKVSNNEFSSSINQLANEISLKVGADNVVSAINMSNEKIKIKSSLVDLTGNLDLEGQFKCWKSNTNKNYDYLHMNGAMMFGYNQTGKNNPVFASGLWTDQNMGYFSVGYTRADYTDENGCLWMSPQHDNNGGRLTFSRLVDGKVLTSNLYFQRDGAIDFIQNLRGYNDTDDNYTYRFDSGVSTRALRCDNLRTYNIYPRYTGSNDIGSASMRYKDIFADSLSTTNSQLRLGTVTSSGAWQTYGALAINSRDGYVYPDKGTGQLSLGTSGMRFHTIFLVNSPNISSDERVKTDIHYLDEPVEETNIIDSEVPRVERNMNITTQDMYDFIKDDLKLASYRYNVNLERGNTSTDYGFIAQDILYTKVGSEIVQLEDKSDLNSNLSYNQGNYIATLAGALQEAIKKIEQLEDRIKELES